MKLATARQNMSRFHGIRFHECHDAQSYWAFRSAARLAKGEIPVLDVSGLSAPPSLQTETHPPSSRSIWIQTGTAEAAIAGYLAWALELPIQELVSLDDMPERANGFLVARFEDLNDALLDRLLVAASHDIKSPRQWEHISRLGLITGRDLNATSWMAAKVVASTISKSSHLQAPAMIVPRDGSNLVLTSGKASAKTVDLDDTVLADTAALAINTHGSEACAKGENGVVFCGRNQMPSSYAADIDGVLDCGRSNICTRGPKPMPIADFGDTLMMSACNGLRLADSINHPDFNFALSYIDGPGVAYVSSLTSTSGASPATIAFLASLADGYAVGDAVIAANALPLLAGIADPAFLCIGNVFHRPCSNLRPDDIHIVSGLPARIDAGGRHTAVIHCTSPELVDQLSDSKVAVDIAVTEARPYAFHRITQAADGAPTVEIRIFSFPAPLQKVSVSFLDIDNFAATARKLIADFDGWIWNWQRLSLCQKAPETYLDIQQTKAELASGLSEKIAQLKWSGHLAHTIEEQCGVARRYLASIAEETLEHLSDELSGSFWLTNQLSSDFILEHSEQQACPQCNGNARRRQLLHALDGGRRHVIVCNRCGIVFDGPGEHAGSLLLKLEGRAYPGDNLKIRATVDAMSEQTAFLAVGLTMPGQLPHTIEPAIREISPASNVREFTFRCRLDNSVAAHRYYVKALLGTSEGLSFASMPFFVHPNGVDR